MTTPNLPAWAEDVHDPRLDDWTRFDRCPSCGDGYCDDECEQEGEE